MESLNWDQEGLSHSDSFQPEPQDTSSGVGQKFVTLNDREIYPVDEDFISSYPNLELPIFIPSPQTLVIDRITGLPLRISWRIVHLKPVLQC